MSVAYIGEIRMFAFAFAPVGWAHCNGQMLDPNVEAALFALIGVTYGGDGITTFAVPDLRGRQMIGRGQGPGLGTYVVGQVLGAESVTLAASQLPPHAHPTTVVAGPGVTSATTPAGDLWASQLPTADPPYVAGPIDVAMAPTTATGGNQPHENRPPSLTISYCICLTGLFPTRN